MKKLLCTSLLIFACLAPASNNLTAKNCSRDVYESYEARKQRKKKKRQPRKQIPVSTPEKTIKAIIANVLVGYLWHYSHLIVHELGHAVSSKIFTGNPINIHIAPNKPLIIEPEKQHLFDKQYKKELERHGVDLNSCEFKDKVKSIRKLYQGELDINVNMLLPDEFVENRGIKFHSSNPFNNAFTVMEHTNSKAKNICMLVAGEASGIIQNYFTFACIAAYHKYAECKDVKQACWYGLKHALTPFQNIHLNKNLSKSELYLHLALITYISLFSIQYIHTSFFPFWSDQGLNYDGTKIWLAAGASEKTCESVSYIANLADLILHGVVIYKAFKTAKEYAQENYRLKR